MSDINIHKFYRNIKTGMFDFFSKNILKNNNPVVVVRLNTNVVDVMFEVMLEHGLDDLHDAINIRDNLVQLEGAARIYVVNGEGPKTSALFSQKCLGAFMPIDVINEIDRCVQVKIIDYTAYESTGIILGTNVNRRKILDIGFMKSINPISCNNRVVASTFENIQDNVFNSLEYSLLQNIYDCKLDKLTPKAAAKFKKQMEGIEGIRNTDMTYDEMYKYMWMHPYLESLTITGIMAGMVKVNGVSQGLPHNAVESFIHLYNQNNR